jgi:xylose dehydrogenase (NAD/NADP)
MASIPQPKPLRVGIMGTAAIASKVRCAIVAAGHVVAAIGSRDLDKARRWAAEAVACGDVPAPAPAAHGSYEALLADAAVDAVYMPLPCALHRPWVEAAARAGKHVVVEKPAATSAAELEAMLRACRAANVALLDGTMFHFHPRQALIEAAARDGDRIGAVTRVLSSFSFRGDDAFFADNIRTDPALEPFGCLGDLGQYSIRFGLAIYAWELPATVRAVAHRRNAAGVPMDVSATFEWPAGGADGGPRTLLVDCAFTQAFRQDATVVGTKGVLRLDDFVISRTHASCDFQLALAPGLDEKHSSVVGDFSRVASGGNQEALMWRDFAAAARGGGGGGFNAKWARMSLSTQACLDAALTSTAADGAKTRVEAPPLLAEL